MPAHTPADVDRIFAAALSAGDLEAAVACYEADAVYVPASGDEYRGHARIREALAALIAERPTLDCWEVDCVENGELALLRARWTYTGTGADGEPFEAHGRSIEVVRRQPDGSWKFTLDLPDGAS